MSENDYDLEAEELLASDVGAYVGFAFDVSFRLGQILDSKKMNQSNLATKMGVSRSYVSQIFKGTQNLTLKKLSQICYHLEVDPRSLFGSTLKSAGEGPASSRRHAITYHIEGGHYDPSMFQGAGTTVRAPLEARTVDATISPDFHLHRAGTLIGKDCPLPKSIPLVA